MPERVGGEGEGRKGGLPARCWTRQEERDKRDTRSAQALKRRDRGEGLRRQVPEEVDRELRMESGELRVERDLAFPGGEMDMIWPSQAPKRAVARFFSFAQPGAPPGSPLSRPGLRSSSAVFPPCAVQQYVSTPIAPERTAFSCLAPKTQRASCRFGLLRPPSHVAAPCLHTVVVVVFIGTQI